MGATYASKLVHMCFFSLGSALGFVWVPSQVCVGAAICKIWFWLHMHNGYSVVCGPC